MHSLITTVTRVMAVGLVSALVMLPVAPVDSNPRSEADGVLVVSFEGASALFHPIIGGEAVSLSVSCAAGAYIQKEYAGTPTIIFELIDQDGLPIADGLCRWEARIHPPVDWQTVRRVEETGDDRLVQRLADLAQRQTVVRSGSFEVADGVIVTEPDTGTWDKE